MATAWSTTRHPVVEVWDSRHLLCSLTVRELRIRYKQSVLGITWAVFVPLSMMMLFTFVFTRVVRVTDQMDLGMPYALFAYAGLVPWTFFATGLNGCVNSLVSNRNLVTKVYFPREVLPLSCIGSALIDFCVASTVLVGLAAYFHFFSDWSLETGVGLLFLPLVLAVQITLMVGIGFLLAMANLFYRDVRQLFVVLIQLWMFATNVVYPLPGDDSWLGRLVSLNPMTPVIASFRDCLLYGRVPDPLALGYSAVVAVLVLIFGWVCFHRAAFRFAERI